MRNSFKLIVVAVFGIVGLGIFLAGVGAASNFTGGMAAGVPGPTPPKNTNAPAKPPANVAANTAATPPTKPPAGPPAGGKTITKSFVLGKDSLSEYGEAPFDHENHAFKPYSPDGKSVVGCVDCHHTDQPKSALKPPLLTTERDVVLTMEAYQASSQKVSECRACHFQEGNVPDGKEMPKATYTEGAKSVTKSLNNELAYHINCNTCHDAAFKLRPELKKRAGFATTKDCTICHKAN